MFFLFSLILTILSVCFRVADDVRGRPLYNIARECALSS
jgi:hypothetical protein